MARRSAIALQTMTDMSIAAPRPGQQRATRQASGSSPQHTALLAWYDRHRRVLPWRALPGQPIDPYRVWLSEIMLQQTTVKAVAPYYLRFLARWPDVGALAAAPVEDVLKAWAGLGYYARARNLIACARAVVEQYGGAFPRTEAQLRTLPGIGAYTAAAIAAIAYDLPATAIDGNVERVIARLYAVATPLPSAKPEIAALARALTPSRRAGDFAQAMIDLGATICSVKRPACALCPWNAGCAAHADGTADTFPRRTAKREGTLRRGAAFVAIRADGFLLVGTRPPKGLLGGMTEVPSTEWTDDFDERKAQDAAPELSTADRKLRPGWRRVPGIVRHVFTHFPLELTVYTAELPADAAAPAEMRWVPVASLAGEALPSLMRKVIAHAMRTA